MRKRVPEYIAYIKMQQASRALVPDLKTCSEFAGLCIENIDSVSIADAAGFYDEAGRAWTIFKRNRKGVSEILIKCKEKNELKYGRVLQAPIKLVDDEEEKEEQNEIPIYVGQWLVFVNL